MKYLYSVYDAKTGELAYKGKAGQLVADGVFSRSDDLSRLWAKQHLKGIRPRKWKVEREEIRPVAKKIAPPGGTTRKVWVYRMTDADGRVVCEGTAVELVEKGFFIRAEDAPNAHRAGHNKRLGVTCVERRKEERPIRIPTGADRKKREGFSERKNVSAKEPEKTEMDALQEDVHALCRYNAAARKWGRKELSYGYWAAAGKPEVPV